ncbi:CubicO group peptidase (beta-lactamase class C family) [Curtobacterium sp. PhB136]|nr:CubicO group peptidase (beta-lactamase class C family) [Curtobacterium sp. PhB136]
MLDGMTTTTELRARVQDDLTRLGEQHGVPGAAVAFSLGTDVVEATHGVLNTRTGTPVTPDSLFQIQSITKVFTATLVMQLVDDGLVALDEPVRSSLPEFRTADEAASAKITVRHLLTHTGGFEGDLWQPTTSGPDALDRFVRDLVSQAAQHSAPGERWSYCNAGYGTLGRLVETTRGLPYEQALRRHLLEPLGIEQVAFSASQALAYSTAIGHVHRTDTGPDADSDAVSDTGSHTDELGPSREWALMPPSNPAAGNQLAMSARGLLALGQLFLSHGVTPTGQRLLSETSVAMMLRPEVPLRGVGSVPSYQSLGWALLRPGVAEHGGGAPGVATQLAIAPDRSVVAAVVTNADVGGRLARDLLDPLFAEFADIAPATTAPVPSPARRVADATPYTGRYATRQTESEVTHDADGRLWLAEEPVREGAAMYRTAGASPTATRNELRPIERDTFGIIGADGALSGTVDFVDPDRHGRFRLLAKGRVAMRRS